MRTRRAFLAVAVGLTLLAHLGEASQGEKDKDADRLQGTWTGVSGEIGGKADEKLAKLTMVIKKDMLSLTEDGGRPETMKFKLDPTKKPRAIDFIVSPTEIIPGIYELKGDTLKICFEKQGKGGRPRTFATKAGTDLTLLVFKRAKK
jgi:uncharacterized protein (TIGR03067 family)